MAKRTLRFPQLFTMASEPFALYYVLHSHVCSLRLFHEFVLPSVSPSASWSLFGFGEPCAAAITLVFSRMYETPWGSQRAFHWSRLQTPECPGQCLLPDLSSAKAGCLPHKRWIQNICLKHSFEPLPKGSDLHRLWSWLSASIQV